MTARSFSALLAALAAGAVMAGGLTPALAQSIVRFANEGPGVHAPFYDIDGTTRLSGNTFLAALYANLFDSSPESWPRISPGQPFRTGAFAGFWTAVDVPIARPANSVLVLQVRVWDSRNGALATFEEARAMGASIGVSPAISVLLRDPPQTTALIGLQSAGLVPTITLTRGVPGVLTDSTALANGAQLSTLCGLPVGTNRWFRLTSGLASQAIVTTSGSTIDTVLSAYTGSILSPDTLTPITCNDDSTAGATTSEVRFFVEPNRLYLLCVAGKHGVTGTIRLSHTLATPLLIRRAQDRRVELSWPPDATNFVVESTVNFPESLVWSVLTNTPRRDGDRTTVQLDCPAPQALYRLRLNSGP